MRNSQDAEVGAVGKMLLEPQPALCGGGGGAQLELWVLGSCLCLCFIPELQIQAHIGALLQEVLIQPLSFPPENFQISAQLLGRTREIMHPVHLFCFRSLSLSWLHGAKPLAPEFCLVIFCCVSDAPHLPPLKTAGPNQS